MSSSGRYGSPYTPYLPARKGAAASSSATTAAPAISAAPHSPPRKVITDFAAFGAPKSVSVFGTAVTSTPFSLAGGKAAFGGIRSTSSRVMDDDDDDDDDDGRAPLEDGRQKIDLVEDSITLDQAKRIAMQSAWRTAHI